MTRPEQQPADLGRALALLIAWGRESEQEAQAEPGEDAPEPECVD